MQRRFEATQGRRLFGIVGLAGTSKGRQRLSAALLLMLAAFTAVNAQSVARPGHSSAEPGEPGGGGTPTVTTYFEQGILIRSGETVEALGPTLMGDTVNEYVGGLQFTNTDVSLPGNNALPVAVGRRAAMGTRQAAMFSGYFGDWDLDIPHLRTIAIATQSNWYGRAADGVTLTQARCSQLSIPNIAVAYTSGAQPVNLSPHVWWDGYSMHIPGAGTQTLLARSYGGSSNPIQPTDGYSYPVLTKQNWQLRCLPSLANGSGEGFVAVSPDGTRYQFDHIATRVWAPYKSSGPSSSLTMARNEIWIMPSQITDRFGNWVRYTYGGADGWRVMSINASDSRNITFTYVGSSNRVQTVNDGTRTWTYGYAGSGALQSVTLPDASAWQFSLADLERDPYSVTDTTCDDPGGSFAWDYATRVGTITHPSGAVGTFSLKMTMHGRSNVPSTQAGCMSGANKVSSVYAPYSLTSKTLSGPGMPAMTWTYAYGPASGSFAPCNGCASTKTVSITDPQNTVTVNTYGTMYGVNEGLLLASAEGWSAGSALRSTTFTYWASNAGPYPATIGYQNVASDSMSVIHTPQNQRSITQQGVIFSQYASDLDIYARPKALTKSNTLGYTRAESAIYQDYTSLWVLGQVKSRTIAGIEASNTEFYDSTALPKTTSKFGKLQASYAFNADGTLYTVKDGLNQTTTYTNYMRGLARNIGYADGTGISAAINNIGTIASVTNEANTTWSYGYDAMGRLASATPPGGNTKFFSFVQVPSPEYGLEANHWRQTIAEGAAVTVNYFDARWRKRLTITYDSNNAGATQRMQRFDYDPYNHTTFAAYPARSIASISAATPGAATVYDPLGRPIRSMGDSELGTLTTTTEYLDGFQKRVTDPRSYATTTSYQVFDEPSESALTLIIARENARVTIGRDVFDKPLSITRSGPAFPSGPASVTRSYVYDGNQLLCKTVDPETGATIQWLDAANNVSWRAAGLTLTNASTCDATSVPAATKASFTYDARNRLKTTTFGDNSPSIARTYTPDGLPETLASNGSTWNYYYNNRRLLKQENLSFPGGGIWGASHVYDPNGHDAQLVYPDGTSVDYLPNALGEPTRVGTYATGVSYHPNGAVAGYTLGNGIVHSVSQNTRGLPSLNADAGVMRDAYAYDANGNIASIADQQEGITNRSMAYDGLDRLIAANAPGVWGNGSYGYDALGNLRTSIVGSRNSTHAYDAKNRLASISAGLNYTSYAYDVQGNVTARGSKGYYFDQGNRLQLANGVASYTYDGLGRRVMSYGTNGSTRWQMYSQSGRLLFGQSVQNNVTSQTRYVYLGGKMIAENSNLSGVTYMHTDALGSPVAKTNGAAGLLSRTRYEAYGNTAAGTVPNNDIGFTGHVNDAGTGLVYMQQRYFDPIAGRFLSVDPVTTDGNSGSGFNRYAYAQNNPYRYIDPDGQSEWQTICIGKDCEGMLADLSARNKARAKGLAVPPSGAVNAPGGQYDEPTWEEIGTVADGLATAASLTPIGLPLRAARGIAADAQFAQKTYGAMFSKGGTFAGKSVDEVSAALRSGAIKPSEVPIDFIVRDGRTIILNTRSAQALEAGGVARSEWNAVNRTGNAAYEGRLTEQLSRNPSGPFDIVRRSGGQ